MTQHVVNDRRLGGNHTSSGKIVAMVPGRKQNQLLRGCAADASPVGPGLKECVIKYLFSYFSTKTYVVGAQKNCLNETVLLSTQNKCLNLWLRKYSQFYAQDFCVSVNLCNNNLNIPASYPESVNLF